MVALWAAMLVSLMIAIDVEGISGRVRRLAIGAALAHALAVLSDAGDGGSFHLAIFSLPVAEWITEVLDVIAAPAYALALWCMGAFLALDRLAGDDAPTVPASQQNRRWLAPNLHACEFTKRFKAATFDWSFIDAAYCISLFEREDRAAQATAAFNEIGLSSRLLFYRPNRHPTNPAQGIWNSHREIARRALAAGHSRIAVFEDDVCFDRGLSPRKLDQIKRLLQSLPEDWQIFFLGHWPLTCRFVRLGLLQTRSVCAHAYIANRNLLEWMATSDYRQHQLDNPKSTIVGTGIDHAFAKLPRAYAVYPMVAIQSASPSDHLRSPKRGNINRLWHIATRTRLRDWGISHLMRPNEARAVASARVRALFETVTTFQCCQAPRRTTRNINSDSERASDLNAPNRRAPRSSTDFSQDFRRPRDRLTIFEFRSIGTGDVRQRSAVEVSASPDHTSRVASQTGGVLIARDLAKSFNLRPVVRGLDLAIRSGEAVGLLGPNGAGKTTVFHMLTGLIPVDQGMIALDGIDISYLPIHRRARLGLSYLPQEPSIFRALTVEANIRAALELTADGKGERERSLRELLEEFQLTQLANSPASALSGGERRRVEIARAMATRPRFILLDEPFTGIDPIMIGDIRRLVRQFTARGIGVLITDHNVRETLEIIDRAYVMLDGQLLIEGSPNEIVCMPPKYRPLASSTWSASKSLW